MAVFSFSVIAAGLERELGDLGDHGLELLVAGDEVGLGIHFDDGTGGAFDGEADQAFGGNARRFLGGLGEALGAQPVDGGFHVAIGGGERRLAVHHAHAGFLAQVLHHRCGDLSHDHPLSKMESGPTVIRRPLNCVSPRGTASAIGFSAAPMSRPAEPCACEMPSMPARLMRSQ